MDKLRSHAKVKIHIENDNLVMYGSARESSGCILRGVLNLQLQETTKIKSIALELIGKMTISRTEGATGHERMFRQEKKVLDHKWTFLPRGSKPHVMNNGSYTYEFELVLPGHLPESTYITNFYTVQYQLKANVERSTFLPSLSHRKTIHLSRRQQLYLSEEPISINSQWVDKLDYEISLPTKIFTHGDQIPVTVRVTPLKDSLKIRHLSCTLKEYMICKSTTSNKPRTHGQVLFSTRDDTFGKVNASTNQNFVEWTKIQLINLPTSLTDLQCDIHNDNIRIRHKVKFVLSLINADGHVSELRAALPITIVASENQAGLPAYGETWKTLPYDPASMLALLYQQQEQDGDGRVVTTQQSGPEIHLPSYNSIFNSTTAAYHREEHPPTYDDEILPAFLVSSR